MRAAALDERDIGQAPLAEPDRRDDVTSSRPAAPPPTTTIRCRCLSSGAIVMTVEAPPYAGVRKARPIAFQARPLPGAMGSTRPSEPQWIGAGIRWRCWAGCDKKMFLEFGKSFDPWPGRVRAHLHRLFHPEREGEADRPGRARDDRSRKADNARKGPRRQSADFRSLRSRRSRRGPDEPAAQPRSRSRASLVGGTRRAGRT